MIGMARTRWLCPMVVDHGESEREKERKVIIADSIIAIPYSPRSFPLPEGLSALSPLSSASNPTSFFFASHPFITPLLSSHSRAKEIGDMADSRLQIADCRLERRFQSQDPAHLSPLPITNPHRPDSRHRCNPNAWAALPTHELCAATELEQGKGKTRGPWGFGIEIWGLRAERYAQA